MATGRGTGKAKLDSKFIARVSQLEDVAGQMAATFRYSGDGRPWHTPDELKQKELLDVPGLHDPSWNRDDINRLYSEEVLKGAGTAGGTSADLIAMKWQADFMAVEERAFRTRHASYARCAAFMHGRLDGHSRTGSSVFSALKGAVSTFIKAGKPAAPGINDLAGGGANAGLS
jgi:hypothetical protein